MKIRALGAALALLGWAAGPAWADYKAGMQALAVKDYVRARAEFEHEADNPQAIYQLARMAGAGLGEARDDTRAANLLKRAADLGLNAAKFDYAFALGNGRGVPKDGAAAVRLLEEMAQSNDSAAVLELGRALRYGWWGQPRDEARAATLFQRVMEAGNDGGTANYGLALVMGVGVPRDVPRGVELLRQAADHNHVGAQLELALILARGELVARDDAGSVALYRKAAETGNAAAQYGLYLAYAYGRGVPRDDVTAFRWADAAAHQGHAWAQVQVGDAYHTGVGVPRLRSEAYYWYSVAARSDGSAAERANERRAILARDMTQEEVERIARRAEGFRPTPGFRPRAEPLPALEHGDQLTLGNTSLKVPMPGGYLNGWQFAEAIQRAYPNDPDLRPLLMVLSHKEDMERQRLGLPGAYRSIEIARHVPDDAMAVTPALFVDLKKQLRDRIQANESVGRFHVEKTVRDDERVYAVVRSGVAQGSRVDGIALVLVKDHVLSIAFTGFRPEHLRELQELVRSVSDDLLSANRTGIFGS